MENTVPDHYSQFKIFKRFYMDVVSIGEVVIDFLPGKESNSYLANPGGAPANVAIAMSRNGLSVGFIAKVGEDKFGKTLIDTLEKDNVVILNNITTDKAITTLVFVHLDEHGERSFSFVRKPGADMFLSSEDVSPGLLGRRKSHSCRFLFPVCRTGGICNKRGPALRI